jgi:phosphoribosylformimino-5-aminoimidazole carboxamide ribotide isomerase
LHGNEADRLRIIPVIDILNGIAVHAVRGKREDYQPLKSILCDSANPLTVARAFRACGFKELYVADLDAIMGKGQNSRILKQIVEKTGLAIMADAGISGIEGAQGLFDNNVSKVIASTETLPSLPFFRKAIDCFGCSKIVASLDLKDGKVLSKAEDAESMTALQLACELEKFGVCEMIVLDLARVGSGEGVDISLLRQMLKSFKMKLLAGGGVQNTKDLLTLKEIGIDGVLLATALHSGKVSVEELRQLNLL